MRAMKDSGIEWIGQIPQEWKMGRVKHVYDVTLGKMLQPNPKTDEDELCSYMCAANINWSGVDLSVEKKMWFSKKDKENYRLMEGDLLVTEGGDVAVSCIWNDELPECYIQNAVHRVRPKSNASNRFLYYWLSTLKATGYIDQVCNKATLAHFTKDKLDSCIIPIVAENNQQAIVSYLDAKCAEIDSLIAAKEKTNALLKERRQSIIYEAVTKGLNPDAPMKDSGIEWIGQIPENWSTVRVKYTGSYKSGNTITAADVKESGNFPVYGGNGLRGYTDEITHDGDHLLIGRQGALCGNVHMVSGKFWASEHAVVGTINANYAIRFLFYVLDVFDLNRLSTSAAQPGISVEQITGVVIPCPTFVEQQKIANVLDAKCAEVDELISANEETIQKLKEYRQSIIYEAVTGKIEI